MKIIPHLKSYVKECSFSHYVEYINNFPYLTDPRSRTRNYIANIYFTRSFTIYQIKMRYKNLIKQIKGLIR